MQVTEIKKFYQFKNSTKIIEIGFNFISNFFIFNYLIKQWK